MSRQEKNVGTSNHILEEVSRGGTSSVKSGGGASLKVIKPAAAGVPRRTVPLASPAPGVLLGTEPPTSSGHRTAAENETEVKKQVVEEEREAPEEEEEKAAQREAAETERSRVQEIDRIEREQREQREEIRLLLEKKPSGSTL